MGWIRKMFEDVQGIPDDARVAAFLIVLTFLGNSIASVALGAGHVFNPETFGIGAGSMAAGVGVWFGARKAN
jgi:hypothetical protein